MSDLRLLQDAIVELGDAQAEKTMAFVSAVVTHASGMLLEDPSQASTFSRMPFLERMTFEDDFGRAVKRGFDNAHAFVAYRTALRADYAAALRIPDRKPATYLPLLNAFRSSTRTARTIELAAEHMPEASTFEVAS